VTTKEFVPGLAGIPAAESAVSYIDGDVGILEYRGYRIEDLSAHATYEECVWLLLYGELPTKAQLDEFAQDLERLRVLPPELVGMLRGFPKTGHPMRALQAALAGLGMVSPAVNLKDAASRDQAARRVIASAPVIVAAWERIRAGKEYVAPKAGEQAIGLTRIIAANNCQLQEPGHITRGVVDNPYYVFFLSQLQWRRIHRDKEKSAPSQNHAWYVSESTRLKQDGYTMSDNGNKIRLAAPIYRGQHCIGALQLGHAQLKIAHKNVGKQLAKTCADISADLRNEKSVNLPKYIPFKGIAI
jgi:hypothetical protein